MAVFVYFLKPKLFWTFLLSLQISIICAVLNFFFPTSASAQSYYFSKFSVNDGLPQSQVYSLLQDSRGYLWLGTQGGGLARFDGQRFSTYSSKDGLQGNYVNALAEDPQGNLWIGTNRGLHRFNGRTFDLIELKKGQDVGVNAICIKEKDKDFEVFLATENGMYSLPIKLDVKTNQQRWVAPQFFSAINGQTVGRLTSAFCDSKKKVWMGGDFGLFRYENGQWQTIQRRKAEVVAISETKDGRILAGIFNSGVLIIDGKKRNFLNTNNGLPSNKVQCFWRNERDGKIWIGTQDAGAVAWLPSTGSIAQITENQGLCSKNVRAILGDGFGKVIWFGTSGDGVCKYATKFFDHFDESDGLPDNAVYAICEGKNGLGRWFSSGDKGVCYWGPKGDSLKSDTLIHFDAGNGFFNVKCRALFRDRKDRIWIGMEGLGLAMYQEQVTVDSMNKPHKSHYFANLFKKNGLAGNWIRDITEDAAGNIWVATTDGGISKLTLPSLGLDGVRIKNFNMEDGLPDRTIHALHFDKKGRLWFASQKGDIGFFEREKITVLSTANGLPGAIIRSLAEDANGLLWAGSAGRGVGHANIYFDKTLTFKGFGELDSLASGNVYLLQADPKGQLWVGTERGVDRLKTDSLGRFLRVKHFGPAEGFRGVETCQNAVLDAPNGELWFGTINGLTHYLPPSDSIHSSAPRPVLTGIRLFYEPLENSKMARWSDTWGGLVVNAVFPHNQNHLGFEFFATDFSNQERVTYSWQLAEQEDEWSPFSNRTEVSYANLPPGNYQFRLRARNEDGLTSKPLQVSFSIEPPFWETWWFRLSVIGTASLLIFGVFKWRIRQVKHKAAQERQQLELQNRLLNLEQKSRQLQMNPHFIFNAMNGIQSLVSSGNMDSARQHILKFGRLMRAVLDNSRQSLIPLDKEVETLRQYLEMEQFCREGKFDFELDTSDLESPDLQVPPMLLQPFAENAILHGIGPLSNKKGMISIKFTERENLLEVTIRDNGIGIEQSQARKAGQEAEPNGPGRQSVGIAVTRERLELMKNEAGFSEPAVEIRQMLSEDGEVEGTEVLVRMGV